ncbi:glycosyltransferase [Cellulomonas avistercoris]|nr:glycosyltransferase [Cellulomonas avistercoris]
MKQADWALVSSHAFAHHVSHPSVSIPKFVYVHSPARYLWASEHDERAARVPDAVVNYLKRLDARRARETTAHIANSSYVRERIGRSWGLEADVVYPPVRIRELQSFDLDEQLSAVDREVLAQLPQDFILGASRMVPYKQLDTVIGVGEMLSTPVVIAGDGPDRERLQARASAATVPTHVVRNPSDNLLLALYTRALALVFPPVEDFGIMPVEAMALGTPVMARAVGGSLETVIDGVSGAFVDFSSASDVRSQFERVVSLDREAVAQSAERFSSERFVDEIRTFVASRLA